MYAILVLPLWFCLFGMLTKRFSDRRDAILAACTAWALIVVLLTEALNLFDALSFGSLVTAWLLISLASLATLFRSGISLRPGLSGAVPPEWSQRLLLGGIITILLLTACVALISAPNNWDSMTYHLPRVMNWMWHHSLANYPTHILRQLYAAPFAEYVILHLQILSGGDRFAACVQYISMVGSVVGVSRLAGKLGCDQAGQLFAAVCCVTIPMGILQGSSTQNDYVTAFWLVCILSAAVDLADGRDTHMSLAIVSVSLGLIALTKPSGLFFSAPFVVWIGISVCGRRGGRRALALLFYMALGVAAINAPHWYRNRETFGALLEPPDETVVQNTAHSPPAIASNLVRNLAMHAATPWGTSMAFSVVRRFHRFINWDINDPRTTYLLGPRFEIGSAMTDENTTGNPLHAALIVAAVFVCLWPLAGRRRQFIYAICVCAGFVLFCALLKWQPWISRLHLPLFVAACPLVAAAFSLMRLQRSMVVVGMTLLMAGLLPATRNSMRPLASRTGILFRDRRSGYFAARPDLQASFERASAELSRGADSRIGIICTVDGWEYPLEVLVGETAPVT